MSDVLNLNRFRKRKQREEQKQQAERNRVVHGRSKADKQLVRFEQQRAEKQHEGRRLEGQGSEPDNPPAEVIDMPEAEREEQD